MLSQLDMGEICTWVKVLRCEETDPIRLKCSCKELHFIPGVLMHSELLFCWSFFLKAAKWGIWRHLEIPNTFRYFRFLDFCKNYYFKKQHSVLRTSENVLAQASCRQFKVCAAFKTSISQISASPAINTMWFLL